MTGKLFQWEPDGLDEGESGGYSLVASLLVRVAQLRRYTFMCWDEGGALSGASAPPSED